MKRSVLCAAIFAALLLIGEVRAHEFIVAPDSREAAVSGKSVPVSVYSTHVFVRGEELEAPESTRLHYGDQVLVLTPNTERRVYETGVTPKSGGVAIVAGHRLPMLSKNVRYEKFAKLLLPVDGGNKGHDRILGQRLELVPLNDPFAIKPGDELSFRVLLDGKPAAFDAVYATYDGFCDIPGAWAFTAPPVAHGEARVKIGAPGLWTVRVALPVNAAGEGYEREDLRAVLTFPVKSEASSKQGDTK